MWNNLNVFFFIWIGKLVVKFKARVSIQNYCFICRLRFALLFSFCFGPIETSTPNASCLRTTFVCCCMTCITYTFYTRMEQRLTIWKKWQKKTIAKSKRFLCFGLELNSILLNDSDPYLNFSAQFNRSKSKSS